MAQSSLTTTIVLLLVAGLVIGQDTNKIPANIESALFRNEPTHARALRSVSHKMNVEERLLQEFNYRANYKAQFQYLRDSGCQGPAPVLQVSCYGPNITLINTSDPSIICNPSSEPAYDTGSTTPAGSTYECQNTCPDDVACQEVYLLDGGAVYDGPFGEIFFQCAGDVQDNVDAFINYLDNGNGECNSTKELLRNFHVARLGVSCPAETGDNWEYVFDDFYFECRTLDTFQISDSLKPSNIYTCGNGMGCEPGAECVVEFSSVVISADLPNFLDKCVETSLPLTRAPTPTPTQSNFTYFAKFEAAWALLYETGSVCTRTIPTVRVTCLNGDIKFLNSTYGTTSCTNVNASMMECNDSNSDNLFGKFTSVVYECSGPKLPETMIEYPKEVAFCVGNGNSTGRHAVQLGVFCDGDKGEYLFSGDLYFDCVGMSPQFSFLDEFGSTGGTRYTCSESATFLSGSNAEQTLPSVAISTDLFWPDRPDAKCFDFRKANATPSPSTEAPVTSSPSKAPLTSPPIQASLTPSPTRSVVISTPTPTATPQRAPSVVSPTIPSSAVSGQATSTSEEAKSSSGSTIGAAVGGAVGGIVLVGMVAFLFLRRRSGSNSGPVEAHKDRDSAPGISAAADNDHSHTESETGRNDENVYSHQADMASTQGETVSKSNSAAASHDSAQQSLPGSLTASLPGSPTASLPGSFPSSSSRPRQRPSRPVEFKDQARSVVEVPLVVATAVAQLIDTSSASAETGVSRRSDPDGRRSIDP